MNIPVTNANVLGGQAGNDALIGGAGIGKSEFFNSFGVDRIIDLEDGLGRVDMTDNIAASA